MSHKIIENKQDSRKQKEIALNFLQKNSIKGNIYLDILIHVDINVYKLAYASLVSSGGDRISE
jgi:hypothetical protein